MTQLDTSINQLAEYEPIHVSSLEQQEHTVGVTSQETESGGAEDRRLTASDPPPRRSNGGKEERGAETT